MPIKNRSDKHKNNKIIKYSVLSVLSIIAIVFSISAVNSVISFTESLTAKSNETVTTVSGEKGKNYGSQVEKEVALEKEMKKQAEKEEKEPEQIPVNDVSNQDEATEETAEEETYSYTYTITSMDGNEYYGESEKDMYGSVYFTQDNIKSGEEFQIGDVVVVSFINDDTITDVELLFNGSGYEADQQEQTEAEIQNDKAFNELEKRTEELKKEVNKNYEAVTGRKDTSYNVEEVTIESIDAGEYTASNGVTFTSDEVYNGIEFEEGDSATVIYDDNGNLFEVNDGIMSVDGSYISPSFYN
ncbi:hypothetical protein ABEY43_06665 [Priestia megaterium]